MQAYGQVIPFPMQRAPQLGMFEQAAGMVGQAIMPTVQNWLGNVFGSHNRPYIEDIKAALELDPSGASISDHSWDQAGLPPGGGQWFIDWRTQYEARQAQLQHMAAGYDPSAGAAIAAAPASASTAALSNQIASLQAQIAAMNNAAQYHADSGDYERADAYDRQIDAMHRQMMQMQAMFQRQLAQQQQFYQTQQFDAPADDSGAWPFDETQTLIMAAAGVGLLVLLTRGN